MLSAASSSFLRGVGAAARSSSVSWAAVRASSSLAPEVNSIGVIGLGLMGHGIAQVAAEVGFNVVAVESSTEAVERGMSMIQGSLATVGKRQIKKGAMDEAGAAAFEAEVMGRITSATELSALADCDFVIEAIIEDMDIKKSLYSDLGKVVKPSAVFASNTSSFEIGNLSESSGRPDKMVGLHFFNPVQIMKLVEVVRTTDSSEESFDLALRVGKAMKKETVSCKDTPGFVVNRLLVPYMSQAILMLQRGDASKEDIDTAMCFGAGYPMGPLTLADYVGLDTCLAILEGWIETYPEEPAFVVPELLRKMVAEGKMGRKSGEGFYKWQGNKKL